MILLAVAIPGVALFLLFKGYVGMAVICLAGFSKTIGWPALIFTSLFLFSKGYWLVGSLPILLIIWNYVGVFVLDKGAEEPKLLVDDWRQNKDLQ